MGLLTQTQRKRLAEALMDLERECKRISALPPQPGERIMITKDDRVFQACVLVWEPNNAYYEVAAPGDLAAAVGGNSRVNAGMYIMPKPACCGPHPQTSQPSS